MDVAWCTSDAVEYTAAQFAQLSDGLIMSKRRHLVCLGCSGRAYYRRRGSNGAAPCFGSNEHADNCDFHGVGTTLHAGGVPVPEPELMNHGDRLTLDVDVASPEEHHAEFDAPDIGTGTGQHGSYDYEAVLRHATSRRRLRSVLRDLARSAAFRSSRAVVVVPSFPELSVERFFVWFNHIRPDRHEGQRRGYWGTIVDARTRHAGDALWLNSGGPDEPSVLLPHEEIDQLLDAHHVDELEDIAGAWVLALGKFQTSQNGKHLIRVTAAGFVALYWPGDVRI